MPSLDDRFDGDDCYIKVNPSGGYFHLHAEDDTSEINIVDIASAISRQCRFTGHLLPHIDHYSVAEHSVLVSALLKDMGASPQLQFAGLMHDAAEAYLADIAAPFKRELGDYYTAEAKVEKRIHKKYGINLSKDDKALLKKADWIALWIEARQIVCSDPDECSKWTGYNECFGQESHQHMTPLQLWSRADAARQFLMRFAELCDEML